MRPAGRTLCARKNVQNRPQMPRAARCCRTVMAKMWTTPCYRNRRRRRVGHYCARRRRAEAPRSMRRAGRTHCVRYFVANPPQMARATSRAIERCCCPMMRMSTTPSCRDRRRRRACRCCVVALNFTAAIRLCVLYFFTVHLNFLAMQDCTFVLRYIEHEQKRTRSNLPFAGVNAK